MPAVLLFGATGYTGRLTAAELSKRGIDFALAGRNRSKLEALARTVGDPEARIADVGDPDALAAACSDVRVLITCVGPFLKLGATAVEAALRAKCHYIDSTGEGRFIRDLIQSKDEAARRAGIAMAPAMGFDEVPADVTAALATEDLGRSELVLTYALPSHASRGTLRSVIDIATSTGPWVEDGRRRDIRAGEHKRWAPMPPPLGPRASLSFPFAEGHLAPLHLDLSSLRLFVTAGNLERLGLRYGIPMLRALAATPARRLVDRALGTETSGPDEATRARSRWTILGEARAGSEWRNVTLSGTDPYGLTAKTLAAAASVMVEDGYDRAGVVSPVQAAGLDVLQKELIDHGVDIQTFDGH